MITGCFTRRNLNRTAKMGLIGILLGFGQALAGSDTFEPLEVSVVLTAQEQAWIAQHPLIKLGIDPEFAPFEYMDGERYSGMTSDFVAILNQRLHLNMQVVKGLSWDQAVNQAKNRQLDVLPAVGQTEERKRYLTYTQAYMNFHRVIITRIDHPFITGLDDMEGDKVAVQVNSSHHGYLQDHSALELMLFDTLRESLLAVADGRANFFVGNVASSTYWIRKLNLTNLKVAAPVPLDVQSLHFAVRNDWPELVSILQKGLDSISEREKKQISEKWLWVEYDPVHDYRLLARIVAIFSGVLALILVWNMMLKRKVRERTSQLLYYAHYDQLTHLPNRFLVLDRLAQLIQEAQRRPFNIALLSIDLDDFKKINDTLTHQIGDQLLQLVATRFSDTLPKDTTLGRLGGDQFLLLLSHVEESTQLAKTAEHILDSLKRSFVLQGRELTLSASIGIAIYPNDADSAEALLTHADSAMHYSKKQRNGAYAFFTEELNQQVSRRLQLEEYLQGALERHELEVVYQPKVNAQTQEIVSFEALLRWYNPILKEVSPVEFIPIAENCGLIEPIGLFVLQQALATLAQWQTLFHPNLSMAVNLSPCQFRSEDLLTQVAQAMAKFPLSAHCLEFEITEGALMSAHPIVDKVLKGFDAMHIQLAIDDFGTGYSSIGYLRKYAFDTLKIDREFIVDMVSDEASRKLVAATIAMAHSLDMKVVAEGVETAEQYAILRAQKCDMVQGWLFSKALPKAQIQSMLVQHFNGDTDVG